MIQRAYSLLEIKAVDDDQRIIEGIASTPDPDRTEDVVEPKGARFKRRRDNSPDIPIKFQHGRDPFVGDVGVGHMLTARPTADGIPVKIQVAKADRGRMKDVLDYVWDAVKMRLTTGLSIGFRSLEDEPIKGTRGLRFKEWEWLELSIVTIPANAQASITSVKAIDAELRAASGKAHPGSVRTTPPGVTGSLAAVAADPLNQKPPGGEMFASRIRDLEHSKSLKQARLQAITDVTAKEGRTKDSAEQEEFDTLASEMEAIQKEISDLERVEKMASVARPVDPTPTTEAGTVSRSPTVVRVKSEVVEPGIQFARFAMCLAAANGKSAEAMELMQTHYPKHPGLGIIKAAQLQGQQVHKYVASLAEMRTKTDVAAGTTAHATWASPLVEYNQFAGDFVEFLRAETIVGKFGQNGVPSLRRIPFNVHIRGQTAGMTGYWVGEGEPKPVTKAAYNDTYHGFFKVGAITVLTEELIRFSDPSAERLVRDELAAALVEKIDQTFIDPTVGAVANVSPASITNSVAGIASSGDTADAVRADLLDLWDGALDAKLPTRSAVYITTAHIALALSLLRNDLGQREFPDVSINGGMLEGVPVIVSEYVPAGLFVLAFAQEIWFSDDGTVTIDASREASFQMMDNPTNDTGTPTHTSLVSMYQTDSVAFRGHRFINWSKRRTQAVRYLHAVSWGGAES